MIKLTKIQRTIANYTLLFFLFGGIGYICYAYFLFSIIMFDEGHKMNELGDSFGALNTLFSGLAFGGVIVTMLMQSRELKNQQKEMRETREEFEVRRITELFFSQLDRFENSANLLSFNYSGRDYQSHLAISKINKILKSRDQYFIHTHIEDQALSFTNEESANHLLFYNQHSSEFDTFFEVINSTIEPLKAIVFNSTIKANELQQLKNLHFYNIGPATNSIFYKIIELRKIEKIPMTTVRMENLGIDITESPILENAEVFIRPILEFKHLDLTNENAFKEAKKKWEASLKN